MPQVHPSKRRKKCITLVALVCNDMDVQRSLPQILIGNYHTFLKREVEAVIRECAPNMIVIRHDGLKLCSRAFVLVCTGSVAVGATLI